MNETVKLLIAAVVGTFGYSLVFRVPKKYWLPCCIGGLLSCGTMLLVDYLYGGLFLCNTAGALIAAAYSHIMARVLKTPSTVLLLASIIPLVPGGSLYYAMSAIVLGDYSAAISRGVDTVKIGMGIAVGLLTVSVAFDIIDNIIKQIKNGKSAVICK